MKEIAEINIVILIGDGLNLLSEFDIYKNKEDFSDELKVLNKTADFYYYTLGLNVIPAVTKLKRPVVEWSGYQDKEIPKEIFETWKKEGKFKDGISIIVGISYRGSYKDKYLVAIDIDKEEWISRLCGIIKISSLQDLSKKTWIEQHRDDKTRAHVFYFSPFPFKKISANTTNNEIVGIEVKSEGKHGLMCVSPSYHKNGYRYQILEANTPYLLSEQEAKKLQEYFDAICNNENNNRRSYDQEDYYTHIKNNNDNKKITVLLSLRHFINNLQIPTRQELEKTPELLVLEGRRHNIFVSIANSILVKNYRKKESDRKTIEELKEYFFTLNKTICSPSPLPDEELKRMWHDALSFAEKQNQERQENDDNNKSGIVERATEYLLDNYIFLTVEETKEILVYDDKKGIYTAKGEILIEKELERKFSYQLRTSEITEIKNHLTRKTYTKAHDFDSDINIINLKNGRYDIQNDKLYPHTPTYYSRNQKPITYDKNARPKHFGRFLKEVLYALDIKTAIDIMAYTFLRENPFEHYFILIGSGGNGKSVYLGILAGLHGNDNVSYTPIQSLITNRFALADLENKDLNIDTELASYSIKDTSILKKLTGSHKIRIEQKNKNAYVIQIHAKLIFNTNKLPSNPDSSDARFRREIIISFPNQFEGKREDTKLLVKLLTEEEKSGIFNVLMKALRRIIQKQKLYIVENSIAKRREKYERLLNPVSSFVENVLIRDIENDVTKEDTYQAFTNYCKYYKLTVVSRTEFDKQLKTKHGFEEGRETRMTDGKRKTTWKNIKIGCFTNMDPIQQVLTDLI